MANGKIQVLIVSSFMAYPPRSGGERKMLNPLLELAKNDELEFSFLYYFESETDELRLESRDKALEAISGFRQSVSVKQPFNYTLGNMSFGDGEIPLYSDLFRDELASLLRCGDGYDIVQIEQSQMGWIIPYVREHSPRSRIVLNLHNVEYLIWRRWFETSEDPDDKREYYRKYIELKKLEEQYWRQIDYCMAVSEDEAAIFREACPDVEVAALPSGGGIDTLHYAYKRNDAAEPRLCYIGSMNWEANTQGLLWFIDRVMPLVIEQYPDTVLHLAGAGKVDERFLARIRDNPRVRFWGQLEDERPFIYAGKIFIVPLWVGAGARVKIPTAWACGIPVVSTVIGAEGLNYRNGQHAYVSDDPREQAQAIVELLGNPERYGRMSAQARQLVEAEGSLARASSMQAEVYRKLLRPA